ncbi:MAG: CRISPR-associated protein Cmr3, partial [Anaerolineae bacterium CG03_land_8_20_14_0_80_58_20]
NIKIIAAALSRYQTISGWDYAKENGGAPKPTRRLVPAGSVYFLNLKGVADIEAFVNAVWLQAISDDDQSRLDGFGLALLGAWDGVMRNMEALS